MMRALLIYLSKAEWARKIISNWSLTWRVVTRFVAGEAPQDAIRVIQELNDIGIFATLDHLGENVNNPEEARKSADDIIYILNLIKQKEVSSGVSIKLSQIGLALDEQLCEDNLRRVIRRAQDLGIFVRIDMEDSPYTEATLRLFYKMQDEGFNDIVGIVIQSYLYRSKEDVAQLMKEKARVRLCKGAYRESADIAYPKKRDVDANFDLLTEMLIDGALKHGTPEIRNGGIIPPIPAIASHDDKRIDYAKEYADKVKLPRNALEFQMLYGIRRELQEQLAEEGYPVRIYIPYGTEWYPYFMRRLAERPANLWFFVSNFFRG